jgi:hypothetical protein
MRIAAAMAVLGVLVLGALGGTARADAKLVRKYAGQIVISPDPVPTDAAELARFVEINVTKDGRYALLGPPWEINLVGFLAKDPGTDAVVLELADLADPKAPPLVSIEVSAKRRIVIAKAVATTAAGFVLGSTYQVRLRRGRAVLARAELTLRD